MSDFIDVNSLEYKAASAMMNERYKEWKPSLYRKIRDWFWWKAYDWVFGVSGDYRWLTVHDKFNAKWHEGWKVGMKNGKEYNESITKLMEENLRLKIELKKNDTL